MPVPMSAEPPFCMTVRTSAKSTFTRPVHADERRDALRRVQQHFVGLLERVLERDALADDGEQPLVRHDDHRVDVLAHLGDALLRLAHALASLEEERPRDDADGERARFARELADRSGAAPVPVPPPMPQVMNTRSAPARHARHLVAILLDRLPADLRTRAGAESARELLADLDLHVGLRGQQRLRVGVDRDELDALEVLLDHAVDGVAAAAADAHDLHAGVLGCALFELEDHCERDSTTTRCARVERKAATAAGTATVERKRSTRTGGP